MSGIHSAEPSATQRLRVRPNDAQALILPLASNEECPLPNRAGEMSILVPGVIPHSFPYQLAVFTAGTIGFLREHARRINVGLLNNLATMSNQQGTVATHLRRGFTIFTPENQVALFGGIRLSPGLKRSYFDAVLELASMAWPSIYMNDVRMPWRDFMVRMTMKKRGEAQTRFCLFHCAAVKYFTTVALARATLIPDRDLGLTFAQQEYAAWRSLAAATLAMFTGETSEQMDALEHEWTGLMRAVSILKRDIEREVDELLEMEQGMKYLLSQTDLRGGAGIYEESYRQHAERVVECFGALDLPLA